MRLPFPEYGTSEKQTIDNLMDTVVKLRKELEYTMYHLGDENIPDLAGMKGDIKGNHTLIQQTENQITLLAADVAGNTAQITVQSGQINQLVTDVQGNKTAIIQNANQINLVATNVAGNTAQIQVQANQISSLVSNVSGQQSQINQLAGSISLKVSYGDVISAINLSPEAITIAANKINLYGITNVNDVLQIGYENTNGEIRFKGNTGTYVRIYTQGMLDAYELVVECSGFYVYGGMYLRDGFTSNGQGYINNQLIINRMYQDALITYGNVKFFAGQLLVEGDLTFNNGERPIERGNGIKKMGIGGNKLYITDESGFQRTVTLDQ